jgi:UDP-N-acetylglucosamine 2-epimerase
MIITVIGARPQFVKAAVLSAELKRRGIPEFIIHTGQHYDHNMSAVFFEELGLPGAGVNLNIGSGNHGFQTGEMLSRIEAILMDKINEVKYVLLYGDTNSTLAGALAAAKLNIPVIHVEAGLRSFNRTMPEEINRVLTDHLSSLLFCSSHAGKLQLEKEGIQQGVYVTGDIMLDAFTVYGKMASNKINLATILPNGILANYMLLTIHRPSNTDDKNNLNLILDALSETTTPVMWPVHPRTKARLAAVKVPDNIHLFDPFSYFEMLLVLMNCQKVITDSGGLQKEAYWAKKPCITIRTETEWTETTANNWNMVSGIEKSKIKDALNTVVDPSTWVPLYGNGNTAIDIGAIIEGVL